METKFILHGGESSRRTDANNQFYKEIIDSVSSDNIKILCVYFARPEHRWQESFYEDRYAFESVDTLKHIEIQLASAEDFREQLIASHVIFINGGFKGFLKEALLGVNDLKELLHGKVVVGISAGANILSKYYYSQGGQEIREGIGLIPVKVFCHYSAENTEELELLDKHKEKLPIYTIEEEKYVIINQE